MKNMIKTVLMCVASVSAVGCTRIQTGEVGVRTTWGGDILTEELEQGMHFRITSKIKVYAGTETLIQFTDMIPTAADNLNVSDLDVDVYYTTEGSQVSEMVTKYKGNSQKIDGIHRPNYRLVKGAARSAIYSAVAKHDSLSLNKNRDALAKQILEQSQVLLDAENPNIFTITQVFVRDLRPDTSIEESIKEAVRQDKRLEAKKIELDIAKKQNEINGALTKSYTDEVLRKMWYDTLAKSCQTGKCIINVDGSGQLIVDAK